MSSADGTRPAQAASAEPVTHVSVEDTESIQPALDEPITSTTIDGTRSIQAGSDEPITSISVESTRSIQTASDELFTSMCDPCNYDGVERQAIRYCQDCNEYLCLDCTESHRRFKNLRNHKILTGKDIPEATDTSRKFKNKIVCSCDQNLEVNSYCEEHKDIICQACKTLKHRKCTTTSLSEKSANYSYDKLDAVLEKVRQLNDDFEQFKHINESHLQNLESMKEGCIHEIKHFRDEMNKILDTQEKTSLEELETRCTQLRLEIENRIDTCSTTNQMVTLDSTLLENVKEAGEKDQMFVSEIKVSGHLHEYDSLLHDIQRDTKLHVMSFKPNNSMMNNLEDGQSLGSLIVENRSSTNAQRTKINSKKVSDTKRINISLKDDPKCPWITGCTFLFNGQAILCDYNNNSIKKLNDSFTSINSLRLKYAPWDVSVIDSKTVVTTQPNRMSLQIVGVAPTLQAGRVIILRKKCFGVSVVEDDIFVSCHKAPGDGEIQIIDSLGNLKRSIGTNRSLLCPSYVTVSLATKLVYIADWMMSKLFCVDLEGKFIYRKESYDLKGLRGIYLADDDSVVACGHNVNKLAIVSNNGNDCNTLESDKGVVHVPQPYSVNYRDCDNTLIVGCCDNEHMYLFKLV